MLNVLLWLPIAILLLPLAAFSTPAQSILKPSPKNGTYELWSFQHLLNDSAGNLSPEAALQQLRNAKATNPILPTNTHWVYAHIDPSLLPAQPLYLGIMFTDVSRIYLQTAGGPLQLYRSTGDLEPFPERDMPVGELVIARLPHSNKPFDLLIRMESRTPISRQFREQAVQSLKIYTEAGYQQRFVQERIIQSFFFGALFIMLFYNLFLFFSLKDRSTLYYSLFTLLVIVFIGSNRGYLFELVLPNYPRIDLYIRFLSTPVMLMCLLLFANSYLRLRKYERGLRLVFITLGSIFLLFTTAMLLGFWQTGRSGVAFMAIVSFCIITVAGVRVMRKGYTPARYFLTANVVLLVAAAVFAVVRLFGSQYTNITMYGLETGIMFQLGLFSLGLADRMNYIRKKLVDQELENASLRTRQAQAYNRLIEEKNRELEIKVQERTSEIMDQNEKMKKKNAALEEAESIIRSQNQMLLSSNEKLEQTVQERTLDLRHTNETLSQTLDELDTFMYRISHDIRGPLARLMGLIYVALGEVEDENALSYFKMLQLTSEQLNKVLSRLSMLYNIKQMDLQMQELDIHALVAEIWHQLRDADGHALIDIQIESDRQYIYTDSRLMRIVLQSLLENALQHAELQKQPKPMIHIKLETRNEDKLISVKNNGKPIPEQQVDKLFRLFSHGDKTDSPGLGLYMVKTTIEKLGGKAYFEEESGMTCFRLRLPVQEPTVA